MTHVRAMALIAIALVSVFRPGAAAQAKYAFDAHIFSLALPAGYTLADEAVPSPGYKTFGWTTPARQDGTNGVIQVSLYEIAKMGGKGGPIDQFAQIMSATLQKTYGEWKGQMSALQLMGLEARRVAWTATAQMPTGALPVQGVMIVGFKEGVYFRVEAIEPGADAAKRLPAAEDALKTFNLTVGK